MMAAVRQRDTRPELALRRRLHRARLRYPLHRGDLPERPDIALVSRRTAVFVHGCFWHRHTGCRRAGLPTTNQDY